MKERGVPGTINWVTMNNREETGWEEGQGQAEATSNQTPDSTARIVEVLQGFNPENAMTQFLFQKDPSGSVLKN